MDFRRFALPRIVVDRATGLGNSSAGRTPLVIPVDATATSSEREPVLAASVFFSCEPTPGGSAQQEGALRLELDCSSRPRRCWREASLVPQPRPRRPRPPRRGGSRHDQMLGLRDGTSGSRRPNQPRAPLPVVQQRRSHQQCVGSAAQDPSGGSARVAGLPLLITDLQAPWNG